MRLFVLFCAISFTASAAPPIADVLRRAGEATEAFWNELASINCTESVVQMKLGADGKPVYRKESSFDYLAVLNRDSSQMTIEESRVEAKTTQKGRSGSLLATNGFPALLLILHPFYQGSFEFSQPEAENIGGAKLVRVDFRQARGARSPSCLRLGNRDYPLEWTGTAWIDEAAGAVVRIRTALKTGMEDVGLSSLTAEVRYEPVRFSGTTERYWMAAEATVEARSAKQHWRNVHVFSNYRRFSVETHSTTEAPK